MPGQLDLDAHECWRILRRRKWWGLCAFLVVSVSVLVASLHKPPVWEASVTMRISTRAPFATIQGASIRYYGAHSGLETETRFIEESASLHAQVIDALREQLAKDPDSPPMPALDPDSFRSLVTAEQVGQSDLIRVSVKHRDPALAVRLANLLASCYQERYIASRTREAEKRMDLIQRNLEKVSADLEQTKDRIKRFEQADEQAGTSAVYRNRLAEVDVQLAELLQRYTKDHPRVVKLVEEKRVLAQKLKTIPSKELEADDLQQSREELQSLRQELKKQLFAAKVDYQAKREEITQKISVLGDAKGHLSIITPSHAATTLVGAMLGAIVGIILCFVVEALDTSFGTIKDVERSSALPVLGLIPNIAMSPTNGGGAAGERDDVLALRQRLILQATPNSMATEACRVLRTNLNFALPNPGGSNILLISSAGPAEGKTLTGLNLATVLAQTGMHTLFIDSDLRHPMAHRALGLSREPGLADLLIGDAGREDCIRVNEDLLLGSMDWDNIAGAHGLDYLGIMPCGAFCPNPAELLASSRTPQMLNELRSEWDCIILDCAPVIPVADPSILAPSADGVLMVYQVGKSSRQLLLRALKQMQGCTDHIIGIVLNHMEEDVQFKSYKYYHPATTTN